MPLTEKVEFKARLQRLNRVQIPKLILMRYKPEPWQILKATVECTNIWESREQYLIRMTKDGRITIPKATLTRMLGNRPNQEGYTIKVTLEPS